MSPDLVPLTPLQAVVLLSIAAALTVVAIIQGHRARRR